jgi:hypothetical protein
MAASRINEKLNKLRRTADRLRTREKIPSIPVDFVEAEEVTVVAPNRSMPARVAVGAWGSLSAAPRPVQVIVAITGLVATIAPIVLAILDALK